MIEYIFKICFPPAPVHEVHKELWHWQKRELSGGVDGDQGDDPDPGSEFPVFINFKYSGFFLLNGNVPFLSSINKHQVAFRLHLQSLLLEFNLKCRKRRSWLRRRCIGSSNVGFVSSRLPETLQKSNEKSKWFRLRESVQSELIMLKYKVHLTYIWELTTTTSLDPVHFKDRTLRQTLLSICQKQSHMIRGRSRSWHTVNRGNIRDLKLEHQI
jgi:hypothetical protein